MAVKFSLIFNGTVLPIQKTLIQSPVGIRTQALSYSICIGCCFIKRQPTTIQFDFYFTFQHHLLLLQREF